MRTAKSSGQSYRAETQRLIAGLSWAARNPSLPEGPASEPPKDWNIYRANRKGDVLLLQLGGRFLLLDTRKQEVREIDPGSVTRDKNTLSNTGGEKDGKPIPSSAWSVRDVGAARRILFKLDPATGLRRGLFQVRTMDSGAAGG